MPPAANPTAAIVVIGNEILSGRTQDVNVAHIARRLADIGLAVREVRVVPDVEDKIIAAVHALRGEHAYVFTTGGIGPTHDDITMPSLAKAFGVALERHPVVEEKLKTYYAGRETAATLRMADFPAGARIVWHPEGWAPGCMIENVVVLAGSPKYMQTMLEAALPLLRQGAPIFSKSVDGWITESQIAADLAKIQERFPELDIGSYPYRIEGRAGTALVVRGTDAAAVDAALAACQALMSKFGAELRAA